ncbi:MAG TPA: hypothetical protein DCS11_06240 [Syntrophus sp. (in: bacteria)]|jgi:hypothetical protein|nr:hypothetical protein [Syntrophus sp. (in: bacteria)]
MSSAVDITRAVRPPRAAFLDYPLGHTTGKPHHPALQRRILMEALDAFNSIRETGSIRILPFRWTEEEEWKRGDILQGDMRTPRHDTPQYQTEEDRRRAEAASA